MSNKKKYILTSITLGAIAAISATIIGLSNLATQNKIKENEEKRVLNGIQEIFGQNAYKSSEKSVSEVGLSGYKYVQLVYDIKEKTGEETSIDKGYAFRTSGMNAYGKITLLVGFDFETKGFKKMSVIANEQSFASTLVDNYINPVNAGEKNYETDVKCDATFGAKLIRDMIDESAKALKELNK